MSRHSPPPVPYSIPAHSPHFWWEEAAMAHGAAWLAGAAARAGDVLATSTTTGK
jgi:hypothetical protein